MHESWQIRSSNITTSEHHREFVSSFYFHKCVFFPEGSTSCASTGPDALHTFTKVQTKIID